jgi:hypothetical protein
MSRLSYYHDTLILVVPYQYDEGNIIMNEYEHKEVRCIEDTSKAG